MTTDDIDAGARAWLDGFGALVAARDFDGARRFFSDDVVSFGTFTEVVSGIDDFVDRQWRNVWPAIEDFAFVLDQATTIASADGLLALAVVPWTSTGFGADGEPFDRPGRATVALRRAAAGAPWRAVHTHFSLAPGVPPSSFGRAP
jgi:ketosteroid isomerase-like protein